MQEVIVIAGVKKQVPGAVVVPGLLRLCISCNDLTGKSAYLLPQIQISALMSGVFMVFGFRFPRIPDPALRTPVLEDFPVPAFAGNHKGTPRVTLALAYTE